MLFKKSYFHHMYLLFFSHAHILPIHSSLRPKKIQHRRPDLSRLSTVSIPLNPLMGMLARFHAHLSGIMSVPGWCVYDSGWIGPTQTTAKDILSCTLTLCCCPAKQADNYACTWEVYACNELVFMKRVHAQHQAMKSDLYAPAHTYRFICCAYTSLSRKH